MGRYKYTLYTVYNARTIETIVENALADECALTMGITTRHFYHLIDKKSTKWIVVKTGTRFSNDERVSKYGNSKTIGFFLKKCRLDRGYTQKQVAEGSDINQYLLCRYEKDLTYPNLMNLISLADFYKVSIDELIGRVIE